MMNRRLLPIQTLCFTLLFMLGMGHVRCPELPLSNTPFISPGFYLTTGGIETFEKSSADNKDLPGPDSQIKIDSVEIENIRQDSVGKYTFIVTADLNKKDQESALSFYIPDTLSFFYESVWLTISLLFFLCLVVLGGYQLRLRHHRREEKNLEKLVLKQMEDLREEKRKTEEQAAQLKNLSQEKNRLIANISHEFRTPLTLTIAPLTELIDGKYGTLTPMARQQADLSLRNARRILRLVGQLMDLARLEGGKFKLHLKSRDLCRYLLTVAEPFKSAATHKNINFIVLMPPNPLMIQLDPDHFDKIIANLLSNAFKFTPENGTVTLKLRAGKNEAIISVIDTGPGIEPKYLPYLFDRFYQIEKSEKQPGSGIGLSLAKELTEQHGSTIDVDSKINKGSIFTIRIPLKADLSGEKRTPFRNGNQHAEYKHNTHAVDLTFPDGIGLEDKSEEPCDNFKSILIVDDHAEIRNYLRQHLTERYTIIEAASGNEAASIISNRLPDLVISDIMMPDGDGLSLLKEIRENPETNFLPVILLTARAEAEDRLTGLGIGADDYITKPFNIREINTRMENLFDRQKRLKHYFTNDKTAIGPQIHHDSVKSHSADHIFLNAVNNAIQCSLSDENFSVEKLAERVNQSRSNLHRRLTKLNGETPSAMIRRIRLERGAQLLSQNAGNVSETAYSIGFKNVSHFSRAFREHFGQSPSEYSNSIMNNFV